MADKALSVPAIRVNNDVIGIVPNSFMYKAGDGETNVRAASTGGGNAVSIHTENAESKFSIIKFSVYPTLDMVSKIRDWKAAVAGNTIDAIERGLNDKDFNVAFKGVSITNDPDINAGADTVIDIEAAGDKLP
jgi:hypothetical protein